MLSLFSFNQAFYLYPLIFPAIFVIGLFAGSFLNLVSDRIINGKPIFIGRSECDYCKNRLKAKNLIPVISFLIQHGRCEYCQKKLSLLYPASEFLTGFLFVLAVYISGVYLQLNVHTALIFFYYLVVFSLYIILFLTDLKYQLVPDTVVYIAIGFVALFAVLYTLFNYWIMYHNLSADPLGKYLLEAGFFDNKVGIGVRNALTLVLTPLIIGGFFALLILVTKGRGMGWGDVSLGVLVGLFNSFDVSFQRFLFDYQSYLGAFLAVFLAFAIGAIFSLILVFMKKKKIKDTIAFGPFLLIASVISCVYGSRIIGWYVGLLR